MPNFESLFSAIVGAVVGGVFAGFGAYVSFSKIIAVLQTKIIGFEASCANCKSNFESRIYRLESVRMDSD
jgi:predicted membrane protein